MQQPSQNTLLAVIQRYVTETKGTKDPLTPDTALLRDGLLDSFNVVAIVSEITKEFQRPIARGAVTLDDFETPAVLWSRLSEIWGYGSEG